MATNVSLPAVCPSCAAGGIRSSVKLYQINLEQAAVFCENTSCPFPLFSQDVCPLVVSHVAAPIPAANSKFKTRSMDTESMTSSCSVSSWASHGSTISSLSSNVATPPPSISSKPFTWPSSQYSVYQPKATMAPKQNNVFDWITPISSSQSSPASSVFSVNDREVEMVMDKSACPTPNSGLTPSPSPTLSDILEAVGSQPSDNNDSYIESLCSFFDEVSEAPTPTINSPANEETTYTVTELVGVQSATVTDLLSQQLQEAATPVRQSTKRVNEGSDLDESNSQSLDSTSPAVAAWKNIELPKKKSSVIPKKKSSVIPKKPQTPRVRKPRARSGLTSSDESTSSSTPTPQSLVSQPQVAVAVNEEGTTVFTINSLALPSTPRPPSSAKKVKATDSRSRSRRPSKSSNPPRAATVKPAEKHTKKDAFCVQSLVNKFILAAKNKKLP
ncbi:flocculation protein FLO11-like [Daphnia pulex]|uniref:flocculation protein FLO11-like n=1 Tax=Daphnia pulex TaxID=6669 RepID=UPI001EDFFFAB|nr:flocculation protein FLO11-like [Daphnia pulex]